MIAEHGNAEAVAGSQPSFAVSSNSCAVFSDIALRCYALQQMLQSAVESNRPAVHLSAACDLVAIIGTMADAATQSIAGDPGVRGSWDQWVLDRGIRSALRDAAGGPAGPVVPPADADEQREASAEVIKRAMQGAATVGAARNPSGVAERDSDVRGGARGTGIAAMVRLVRRPLLIGLQSAAELARLGIVEGGAGQQRRQRGATVSAAVSSAFEVPAAIAEALRWLHMIESEPGGPAVVLDGLEAEAIASLRKALELGRRCFTRLDELCSARADPRAVHPTGCDDMPRQFSDASDLVDALADMLAPPVEAGVVCP